MYDRVEGIVEWKPLMILENVGKFSLGSQTFNWFSDSLDTCDVEGELVIMRDGVTGLINSRTLADNE